VTAMVHKRSEEATSLVSLEEQWLAIELMRRAAELGEIPEATLQKRLTAVWRSNTPHELWRATGGRAGQKRRGDWPEWRRAAYLVAAIVPLAVLSLWIIAWGLRQYYDGG